MSKVACIFKECYVSVLSKLKVGFSFIWSRTRLRTICCLGCREMKESSQDFCLIGKKRTLMNSPCLAPSSHCSYSFLRCLFFPKNLPPLSLLSNVLSYPHKQTTAILVLVLEGNCGKLHVWHGPRGIMGDQSILNQVWDAPCSGTYIWISSLPLRYFNSH